MQFCSLHHRVLFFLIFTFTTAPVSALEICPTRGKLHQPVTLSCTSKCSGSLMWNLLSKRDVVLARCDQTCWAEEGFSISHDQYLNGDFSLTITEADYSKRNVYACECGATDYAYVRLVIETVFTPVQMKSDEDLKLNVSVPEPVEVIYKSSDAADEVICNVTNGSLQCKDAYRDRTSLTYPELTLKHMTPRDSGSYTIRDTKNNEDIQIYAVAVEDRPGVPVWVIVLILDLVCCCFAAGIFLLYKRRMRKWLERRQQQVNKFVQEAEGGTEEKIREVEMSLKQLQQQYNNTVFAYQVKEFCSDKRRQLLEWQLQQVDQLVQEAEGGTEKKISRVEMSLNQLQQQYNNTVYKDTVKMFCSEKREQLLNIRLLPVVQLLQQNKEWEKEDTERVERELKQLMDLYRNTKYIHVVSLFCMEQRSQMNWYRLQYSKEESLMTKRRKLNRKLHHVEQLVQQAKAGTEEMITEAEKAIDELELQYSITEYSKHVSMLCEVKRNQLNPQYSNDGLITPEKELSRVHHVEQLVQQAERGTEEKISEARKEISELELQYFTTEYSGCVSLFCMTKRAELFWCRLLHSDILRMTE